MYRCEEAKEKNVCNTSVYIVVVVVEPPVSGPFFTAAGDSPAPARVVLLLVGPPCSSDAPRSCIGSSKFSTKPGAVGRPDVCSAI